MNIQPTSVSFMQNRYSKKIDNIKKEYFNYKREIKDNIEQDTFEKAGKFKKFLIKIGTAILAFFIALFSKKEKPTDKTELDNDKNNKTAEPQEEVKKEDYEEEVILDEEDKTQSEEEIPTIIPEKEIEQTNTFADKISNHELENIHLLERVALIDGEDIRVIANNMKKDSYPTYCETFSTINEVEDLIAKSTKNKLLNVFSKNNVNEVRIKNHGYFESLDEFDENGMIKRSSLFDPSNLKVMSISTYDDNNLIDKITMEYGNGSNLRVIRDMGIKSNGFDIKHVNEQYVWTNEELESISHDISFDKEGNSKIRNFYEYDKSGLTLYKEKTTISIKGSTIEKAYSFKDSQLIEYVENYSKNLGQQKQYDKKLMFENGQLQHYLENYNADTEEENLSRLIHFDKNGGIESLDENITR